MDPAALDVYKVGSYAAWRLGKKALGYYLPFRFALGNPFHAGALEGHGGRTEGDERRAGEVNRSPGQ